MPSAPVKTDETEVHDGGGGEENVQGGVHVAPQDPKHPVAEQL